MQAMEQSGTRTIRCVLIEGDLAVRRRLRGALEPDGIAVVASADHGAEASVVARNARADVALVGTLVPGTAELEALRAVLRSAPQTKVVAIDHHDDPVVSLAALRLGASGIIARDESPGAVARVVHGVLAGEAGISRALMGTVLSELRAPLTSSGVRPVRSVLTTREWEVLDLLCEGLSTAAMADRLVLSRETIRSHVKSILRKLGVSTRREAVAIADEQRRQALLAA